MPDARAFVVYDLRSGGDPSKPHGIVSLRGGAMFLNHSLFDVLAAGGIDDIDGFLQAPSWNDLLDPMSIPFVENEVQ